MASLDNTTTNCAACGKEGPTNTCNKCKIVKYCNAACKKKHRSKHKKACERSVAELHDLELFKQPPPREDCPICFLLLPLDEEQFRFFSCCGKVICCGCTHAMREDAHGRGKDELCAFCREPLPHLSREPTPSPSACEKIIKQLQKLIEADNKYAFHQLALYYARGDMGVPQDLSKANELFLRAGELGWAGGYNNIGNSYHFGTSVEIDKEKAKHYWELAAMNGHVYARHNLGCLEGQAGNEHRAMEHFILGARAGHKNSLDKVKKGFMNLLVTKDEYANTLRAYQSQQDEMKSDTRYKARAH